MPDATPTHSRTPTTCRSGSAANPGPAPTPRRPGRPGRAARAPGARDPAGRPRSRDVGPRLGPVGDGLLDDHEDLVADELVPLDQRVTEGLHRVAVLRQERTHPL